VTVCAGDQVPVGIHGDLDGMMPHLVLHVGEGFPVPDEPGREGMPQVVEADRPKPVLFSPRICPLSVTSGAERW